MAMSKTGLRLSVKDVPQILPLLSFRDVLKADVSKLRFTHIQSMDQRGLFNRGLAIISGAKK